MTVLLFAVHSFPFAGHQGSSQSDLCTNTGFVSFKLPTCGMATERTELLPWYTWIPANSGSWDMLHVGLEHVGSLHVILHMLCVGVRVLCVCMCVCGVCVA